jgi:hypothetical protein
LNFTLFFRRRKEAAFCMNNLEFAHSRFLALVNSLNVNSFNGLSEALYLELQYHLGEGESLHLHLGFYESLKVNVIGVHSNGLYVRNEHCHRFIQFDKISQMGFIFFRIEFGSEAIKISHFNGHELILDLVQKKTTSTFDTSDLWRKF